VCVSAVDATTMGTVAATKLATAQLCMEAITTQRLTGTAWEVVDRTIGSCRVGSATVTLLRGGLPAGSYRVVLSVTNVTVTGSVTSPVLTLP
jgi:hypothetical protein